MQHPVPKPGYGNKEQKRVVKKDSEGIRKDHEGESLGLIVRIYHHEGLWRRMFRVGGDGKGSLHER